MRRVRQAGNWRLGLWLAGCALTFSGEPAGCRQDTSWEAAMAAGQQAAARGDFGTAERSLSGAIVKAERFGRDDPRVALSLSQLAQVYAVQGKYVEAEPLYGRALKIYQSARGEESLDVAATLNNLGVLHRMHGQYSEAEPYLKRALAIKEKLLGPMHQDVALSAKNLAMVYFVQGRYEQAESLFRRALAIREQEPDTLDLAKSLEDYAGVLRKLQRQADAERLEARAKAIRAGPGS